MWWNRKDPPSAAALDDSKDASNTSISTNGSRRSRKDKRRMEAVVSPEPMCLAETQSGIEVSFSKDAGNSSSSSASSTSSRSGRGRSTVSPPFALKGLLAQRSKVYRAQFRSIRDTPDTMSFFAQRQHRVPLTQGKISSQLEFKYALNLLQSFRIIGEGPAVHEELKQMDSEIRLLEQDRSDLAHLNSLVMSSSEPNAPGGAEKLLLGNVSATERAELQEQRGLSITFSLSNPLMKESFMSKCGSKVSVSRQYKNAPVVTLGPSDCRDGGAATTVYQFALLSSRGSPSFFLSRDTGKSFCWGRIPDKLFRRMKDSASHSTSDLVYLATGPMGCYYATFRSGEVWWGSAVQDEEFHEICRSWDISRVVFGPSIEIGSGACTSSWIIISRDGRAAWKNLPARLHHLLERRMANQFAPVEVSLGCAESYFVRFLDGTTDYCLPAQIAQVCHKIERSGGAITSMTLHPALSQDFIIRHR